MPNERLKLELKSYLPYLLQTSLELDKHNVCHAFIKGRNCATNALQHIGYKHTISLDLHDFFDSIKPHHVEEKIPEYVISKCFVDGAPRQGLPTSPLIANIALADCDNKIITAMKLVSGVFAYTRYADDICISVDDKKAIAKVQHIVSSVLSGFGFELNVRKTRVQSQENGRRIITGIGVDQHGLHPTRKTIKKLRAALHQGNRNSIEGLSEWAKCKLPAQPKKKRKKAYRPLVTSKYVACKHCGEDGLKWNIEDGNRFILISSFNKQKHICNKLPAPISKDDLQNRLSKEGFEGFQPKSKTWTVGYYNCMHNNTLFVLIRKNGIDLGIHRYEFSLKTSSDGYVRLSDGQITSRHTYENSSSNVHSLTTDVIEAFVNGVILNLRSIPSPP